MDFALKNQWVKALRSGNYEQGKNLLRSKENKFCCLGVLCDLMNSQAWDESYIETVGGYYWGASGAIIIGFDTIINTPGIEQGNLTNMNDTQNKSFAEIADFIEANVRSTGDLS